MKTNYSSLKFVKSLILLVLLTICNISNAETYYMIVTNGNWDANTTWSTSSNGPAVGVGVYPGAGDDVIIDGSVQRNLFINISNAQCASIKNQMTATDGSTFTVSITGTNILTVSGDFDITGSTNYSRTTTLTGTGTLAIGGNINVGTDGITPTVYRTNVMNFNGPNITVAGNVNIYNRVNGTIYIASSINHSSGKLTLSGNGSTGYLNTFQNGTGLNGNNFYATQNGSAIIEFHHVLDCPIYAQNGTTNSPILNANGTKVYYIGNTNKSIIFATTYYDIYLNNSSGYKTNGTTTINNLLNISSGTLDILNNVIYMSANSTIDINNTANPVTGSADKFIYNGPVNVNYSGTITSPGIELRTGLDLNSTLLNNLSINGTYGFDISRNGNGIYLNEVDNTDVYIYSINSISITDNNLRIDLYGLTSNIIELNGGTTNPMTINADIITNSGIVNINGKVTANNPIEGDFITLIGNNSSYQDEINSTNELIINGSNTFSGNIYCYNLTTGVGSSNSFSNPVTATNNTTLNGTNIFSNNLSSNNILTNTGGNYTFSTVSVTNSLSTNGTSTFNSNVTSPNILIIGGYSKFKNTVNSQNISTNLGAISIFDKQINNNNNFTINGTTTLTNSTVNISNNLYIGGTLYNRGKITTNDMTVTQNSFLIKNSSTASVNIKNLLSINNGATLNTGDELVLISDANNTARVAEISSGNIEGKVKIQRYLLNSKRLWRLLTTPLKGSTDNTIFINWQNNGISSASLGTDIWGNNQSYSESSNGLIYLPISTHNFRKYINGSWQSVINSKTEKLFETETNNAFLAFIVAPKGLGTIAGQGTEGINNSISTTLESTGNLIIGDQTYTINNTNYYLIGNPYASPIDFYDLIDSNGENGNTITPKIWLLDPLLGAFGNYVTWDPVNQYSNPQALNAINGQNNTVIQSGQAFFVKGKTGATSSNFYIHESNKTSTVLTNVFGRNANTNFERIRVNLEKVGDTIPHRDACVVGFYNGANNNVDDNDVQKFSNPTETLAFLNGTTSLSSEHRAPIVEGDELFLKLTNATISSYKLKIYTENFTFSGSAFLHDLTLGTITNMPLDGRIFEYPFEVTADSSTQGARFKIVFTTTLSIDDNTMWNISAYPNPTSKNSGINVNLGTLDFGNYTYRVINMLGQEIQKGNLNKFENNQEFKIDFTTAINSGIYSFEVVNNNKTIKTIKLVIK